MHLVIIRRLAGLLLPLLLAGLLQAQQVVSYLAPIDPALVLPTAAGDSLQLPGFDSSLGTLLGVTLSFNGFASQQAQGENYGGTASPYTYSVTSALSLQRVGGPTVFDFEPVTLTGSGNLAAFDGGYDFAGPSGFSSGLVTTPLSGLYVVPEELLASYLGLAPIDFTANLTGSSLVSGPGSFLTMTSNGAEGTLGVTYTYALIPEPSAYAALAGLAVLCATASRRRWRAAV